jgi:hypothetical protein
LPLRKNGEDRVGSDRRNQTHGGLIVNSASATKSLSKSFIRQSGSVCKKPHSDHGDLPGVSPSLPGPIANRKGIYQQRSAACREALLSEIPSFQRQSHRANLACLWHNLRRFLPSTLRRIDNSGDLSRHSYSEGLGAEKIPWRIA